MLDRVAFTQVVHALIVLPSDSSTFPLKISSFISEMASIVAPSLKVLLSMKALPSSI